VSHQRGRLVSERVAVAGRGGAGRCYRRVWLAAEGPCPARAAAVRVSPACGVRAVPRTRARAAQTRVLSHGRVGTQLAR